MKIPQFEDNNISTKYMRNKRERKLSYFNSNHLWTSPKKVWKFICCLKRIEHGWSHQNFLLFLFCLLISNTNLHSQYLVLLNKNLSKNWEIRLGPTLNKKTYLTKDLTVGHSRFPSYLTSPTQSNLLSKIFSILSV